ncbi:MAG: hypothetical protein OXG08_00590 [Gammaproteobacteria bacterium]|nr:hypothetical protein [Gammaproteobacteria bacterium]
MAVNIFPRLKSLIPALAGFATACALFSVLVLTVFELPRERGNSSSINTDATSQSQYAIGASTEKPVGGNTLDGAAKVTTVAALVELESEYARAVALRQMLANANEKGALELLDQLEAVARPKLRLRLQKQIVQKLASINPVRALAHVQELPMRHRNQFFGVVFKEWSLSSLDDALSYAKSLEDKEKLAVVRAIFQTRDDLSKTSLNQIAHDLGYSGMATRLQEDKLVNSASLNPADSWNQILEDPWRDHSQIDSLSSIASAWIEAEGREVLYQIAGSLSNHHTRTQVVQVLLGQIATQDPQIAFEYATSLYDQTDESIFRLVLYWWTTNDPYTAWKAVNNLDNESLRLKLQTAVANRWARIDPLTLLQRIADFPAAAQANARSRAIAEISKASPRDAIDVLAQLPSSEVENAAKQLVYQWALKNVQEVMDWIQTDPTVQDYQEALLAEAFRVLVRVDSEAAMNVALDRPMDSSQPNLEYEVIRLLVIDNKIEESISLLLRMREGDSQSKAFVLVATQLVVNEEIDRVMQLGKHLDDSRRDSYFSDVLNAWAFNDAQRMFLSLDDLPNVEVKHLAANALARYSWKLNEDQVEYVRALADRKSHRDLGFRTTINTNTP